MTTCSVYSRIAHLLIGRRNVTLSCQNNTTPNNARRPSLSAFTIIKQRRIKVSAIDAAALGPFKK